MGAPREDYWRSHYERLAREGQPWLDLSNERVQAQGFALALEAAGPVAGKRCLDVGCGSGLLAVGLLALGAAEVTGLDLVDSLVEEARAKEPRIAWRVGSPADVSLAERYDLVFLVEVLQYVAVASTLERMWEVVRPEGRVVGLVPNAECPIVRRAAGRFDGRYAPPSPAEIADRLGGLPGVERWELRGLSFRSDQALLPYEASAWSQEPRWPHPPNRLLFVAMKR